MQVPKIDKSAYEGEPYSVMFGVKIQPTLDQHLRSSIEELGFVDKAAFGRWLISSFFCGNVVPRALMVQLFNSRYAQLLADRNYYKSKCAAMNQFPRVVSEYRVNAVSERETQVNAVNAAVNGDVNADETPVNSADNAVNVAVNAAVNEQTNEPSIFDKFKALTFDTRNHVNAVSERETHVNAVNELVNGDVNAPVNDALTQVNAGDGVAVASSYNPQVFHDLVQKCNALEQQNATLLQRNATLLQQIETVTQQVEALQAKPFVELGQHVISDAELQEVLSLKEEHTAFTEALTKGMLYITQTLEKHSNIVLSATELISTIEHFKAAILSGENVDELIE